MEQKIICPYCFEKFNQDDVLFRAETCFTEDDILDDIDIDMMEDGPQKNETREKNELKKAFLAKEHPSYKAFWSKYNGTTEQTRRRKSGILGSNFENYQKPIISPKNPRHVIFDNQTKTGVKFDRDGFLTSVTDIFGKHTSNRVCPECCNPLPINYGKFPVKFISVIGITRAGKTVYLSSLLDNMYIYADKIGMTPLPNDAVNFFIESNKIGRGITLPQGTSPERLSQPLCYNLQYFHQGKHMRETSTFVLYDIAGENCVSPEGIVNFGPFIAHSDGIIILQDPKQFTKIFGEAHAMINSVLGTIIGLFVGKQYCDIPIALCISKADRLIEDNLFDESLSELLTRDVNPAADFHGFCASEYNEISDKLDDFYSVQDNPTRTALKTSFNNFNYFAVSSLNCQLSESEDGKVVNGEKMLMPIENPHPLRIEEPLFWLFYQFGFIKSDVPVKPHAIVGEIEKLNDEIKSLMNCKVELENRRIAFGRNQRIKELDKRIQEIQQRIEQLSHY